MQPETIQDLMNWAGSLPQEDLMSAIMTVMTAMMAGADAICGQQFVLTAVETGNSVIMQIPCLGRPM